MRVFSSKNSKEIREENVWMRSTRQTTVELTANDVLKTISEPDLPSLPVFRVDYPFFTTSTRLPVYPFFNISTSFGNCDFQKNGCIFTGKYRRNSRQNKTFYELPKHFISTRLQSGLLCLVDRDWRQCQWGDSTRQKAGHANFFSRSQVMTMRNLPGKPRC